MSGGHFDYLQRGILNLAEDIEEELDRQNTPLPEQDLIFREDYYKEYPEDAFYPVYPEEIQQRFRDAIKALKRAYIYVQRIDWYLSGDDGEKDFLERLEEELKELEEK